MIKRIAQNKYRIDYRDAKGARHREIIHGSREDAIDRDLELRRLKRAGQTLEDVQAAQEAQKRSQITLSDFLEEWERVKYPSIRPNTEMSYKGAINEHILPYLGDVEMRLIDQDKVQEFVSHVYEKPKDPRTVENAFAVLAMILKFGATKGLSVVVVRQSRGMPGVILPRKEHVELVPPTIDEIHDAADRVHPMYRALILLSGYCGLRQSEAFALAPDSILWDENRILVRRTVEKATHSLKETKTRGSRRSVVAPDVVMDALRQHVAAYPHDNLVFHTPRGKLLDSSHFWAEVWQPLGVDFTFRDLRHSAPTILASLAGWGPKEVQAQMGHKSAAFTLDRYQGLWESQNEANRAKLNDALAAEIQRKKSGGGGTRTPTPLPATDFESVASTDSATPPDEVT